MVSAKKPSVFVSSTCYDLGQLRSDLRDFLISLGLEPVLSEFPTFPVDPDQDTVTNCLKAVENTADILVLIVGGRYGNITDSGKSVTNLEYLRAKEKGIPIYVFVLKSILSILPIWRDNREGDFKSAVDSPKLFEFVEELRKTDQVWVYSFENAKEITGCLKEQLPFLFADALELRARCQQSQLPSSALKLQGQALRLVLERPFGWQIRIMEQIFSDFITAAADLKRDLKYGINIGRVKRVSDTEQLRELIMEKNGAMLNILSTMTSITKKALPEAMGASGESSSVEGIVYVASRLGQVYTESIRWAVDYRQVAVPEVFEKFISLASTLSSNIVRQLEELRDDMKETVSKLPQEEPLEDEPYRIVLKTTLDVPDTVEMLAELNRALQAYAEDDAE